MGAGMDKRLLIAVDESENSKMSLLYVADFLGGVHGFKIKILSVLSVPDVDFYDSEEARQEWLQSKKENLSEMIKRYREILIQSGFPEKKVETEVAVTFNEPVSSVIIRKREEYNACTLIIGRRGVSKTDEFLFGSVSNKIIHKANKCAVWVVEPVCKTAF
jgi:nucleotide-binding universal stress UspA family protein